MTYDIDIEPKQKTTDSIKNPKESEKQDVKMERVDIAVKVETLSLSAS